MTWNSWLSLAHFSFSHTSCVNQWILEELKQLHCITNGLCLAIFGTEIFRKKIYFFLSICTLFMFLLHDPLQQGTKIHLHKAQFCLYSFLRCLLAVAVGGGYSECQVHITFLYIQYLTVSYHLEQRAHYWDYSSCRNVCPINANILNTIQSLPEILNHIPFEQNILTSFVSRDVSLRHVWFC